MIFGCPLFCSTFQTISKPVRTAPLPPQKSSPDQTFCTSKFDYKSATDQELTVYSGQRLFIHATQDLQTNKEWWLVENENGDTGYVPANYLDIEDR